MSHRFVNAGRLEYLEQCEKALERQDILKARIIQARCLAENLVKQLRDEHGAAPWDELPWGVDDGN